MSKKLMLKKYMMGLTSMVYWSCFNHIFVTWTI